MQDGVTIAAPRPKKARLLVAHLALHPGRTFLREDLAAHLWPDQEPSSARFNLRQLLATVRREAPALAPYVHTPDHQTISFFGEEVSTDVERFLQALDQRPAEAIELYKGELLPGIDDDWVNPARADLERRFVAALLLLAERSEPESAVRYLRRAASSDPFNEPVQASLLRALAEIGDFAGMEAAYRRFTGQLKRELGVDVSLETQELYRSLGVRSTVAGTQGGPVTSFPRPLTDFVGRQRELSELTDALEGSRLITVTGPGGVGKTRFAIEFASTRSGQQWFVDLAALAPGAPVEQAVATTLGVVHPGAGGWLEAMKLRVANDEALIVLDNCEHVLSGCSVLARGLLECCPKLRILATSRTALAVPAEQLFALDPLELPEEGSPVETVSPAVELFLNRARLLDRRMLLTVHNAESVLQICRCTEGMPLAIEMAAARSAAMPLDELAQRLAGNLVDLESRSPAFPERQRTLERVTEWSYELLSEPAKVLLLKLAVFAGGSDLTAIEAICGEEARALPELVDASLLQLEEGRYSMLVPVHSFASARLGTRADDAATRTAHAAYFFRFCSSHEGLVSRVAAGPAGRVYQADVANLRQAYACAQNHFTEDERLKFAASLSGVLALLQQEGEAAQILRKVLEQPVECRASEGRIAALRSACRLFQSLDLGIDRATARADTTRVCEELIEVSPLTRDKALANTYLAGVLIWWDRDAAKRALDRAFEYNEALDPGERLCLPVRLLAQWHYDARDFERALELYREGGRRAKDLGDRGELLSCLQGESHLQRELCHYDAALQGLLEVSLILRDFPDSIASAFNDLRLAELHLDRWDFDSMEEPLKRADAFFVASGNRFHALLTDSLRRYLAAHRGLVDEVAYGIGERVEQFLVQGQTNPSACWHGACIDLEALTLCLAGLGWDQEAGAAFAIAIALRHRDWSPVTESVRARWLSLAKASKLQLPEPGQADDVDAVLRFVRSLEHRLLRVGRAVAG